MKRKREGSTFEQDFVVFDFRDGNLLDSEVSGLGGVLQALAEMPDGDNIHWNNTALSSLAGTWFSNELWVWPWGNTERGEWSRKGVQSKWSLQNVRFYVFNHLNRVGPVRTAWVESRVSVVVT